MDLLLITTIGHTLSAVVLAVAGVLVLLQNPSKTLNRAFFISALSAGVWGLGFAMGINLEPSPTAYLVWLINLTVIPIVAGYLHFTFAAVGRAHEARWVIRTVYVVGGIIFLLALFSPQLFLPEVSQKLFVKSYLNAGPLYVAMFIYFAAVFFMSFVTFVYAYFSQKENRRVLEYFIIATIFGYSFGPIDFFLVFDIPVSPLYGMFFGLYIIPITYGILADHLMDIRVVVRKAFFYSFAIGAITAVLTVLIFLNDRFVETVPWVQFWTIPIVTAVVAFFLGRVYWLQSVEGDRIKYEFITVATHKLRTPLTQISWKVRELIDASDNQKEIEIAQSIQRSTNRLIELTNILFETTQESDYTYNREEIGLVGLTNEVFKKLSSVIEHKNIQTSIHVDGEVRVFADQRRIHAVIEVLLENAITYTPNGGFVQVIAYDKGGIVSYSVRDSGIGVVPEEKKRIFSRFYRTDAAKRVDTEGVGLGLAMAKSIIQKHGGKIGVESQGEDKGSIFWFTLPKN